MIRGNSTYTVFVGSCRDCGRPFESPTDDVRCDHPARTLRELKSVRPFEHVSLKRTKKPVTEYTDGAVFDGHDWLLPEGEFDVTVSPGLSDAGKEWLRTARRPSAYAKRCVVPDRAVDARRAFAALQANPATEAQVRTFKADAIALLDLNPKRTSEAQWWSAAVLLATTRTASWHAFNDQGKVVLSLRCDRDAALDCAMAYNAAGGSLILLSPTLNLDDCTADECVAVPEEHTAPPPSSPTDDFAGTEGLLVDTAWGRVALRWSLSKGSLDRRVAVIDPRLAVNEPARLVRPHAFLDGLSPEGIESWAERAIQSERSCVGFEGPVSKLPKAIEGRHGGKVVKLAWFPQGDAPFRGLLEPGLVKAASGPSKAIRADLVAIAPSSLLRITRDDGCIGVVGGWDPTAVRL